MMIRSGIPAATILETAVWRRVWKLTSWTLARLAVDANASEMDVTS